MSFPRTCCCCFVLLGTLFLLHAAGQVLVQADSTEAGGERSSSIDNTPAPTGEQVPQMNPRSTNAIDLATHELIRLEDLEGGGILYGASGSQGYGWVQSNTDGNSEGSLSLVRPYVGIFDAGRRTTALFQYAPTIDVYDGRRWDGGIFNNFSADGYHSISERLTLHFSGAWMGGPDAIRELATLGTGGGNGGVEGLAYALPKGSANLLLASTGLHWMHTPRQEISVTLINSFSSVQDSPKVDNIGMIAEIRSDVGRRSRWHSFLHLDFSSNNSDKVLWLFGSGFGTTLGKHTTIDLGAGPQFTTGVRYGAGSVVFSGSLKQDLTSRTALYVTAERDYAVSYLSRSRWADQFTARLRQQINRSTFVRADAGYVRATDINTGIEDRHGFFAGPEFQWRATSTMSFVSSYRYFKRDNPTNAIRERHNWLMGTLVWQPSSRILHP